jgi:penicillin amidase
MHTGYRPSDFRTVAGASVRIVMDVGAWDESRWINAPGQSGDPRSPHYRDLAPIWAGGGYVPMLYSRQAVDAAARARIRLEPAPAGTGGNARPDGAPPGLTGAGNDGAVPA